MISQALFSSFSAHFQFVSKKAIASLSLLLLLALHPPAHSQEQTGGHQTSAPTLSGAVPENRSILKPGSQGGSVSDLQALLKLLGFYKGAIDGVYRDGTANAVTAFQQAAGLQADGIVGVETWARLLPPSPVINSVANTSTISPLPSAGTTNTASTLVGGAIASNNTPSQAPVSNTSLPSLNPSPTASSSAFPAPTAQLPSNSSPPASPAPASPAPASPAPASPAPAPAISPAPQTPAPQTPAPQTPTPQTSSPDSVSAPVDLPVLRVGMRGPAVNSLQERLKAIGAFKGIIDGIFGLETQEAVKTAQRNFNLEPDGIVGPATWDALLR